MRKPNGLKAKAIKSINIAILIWLGHSSTVLAQTDVPHLEAALKGKRMALRSYSADPVVSYALQNDALIANEIKVRTLCLFTTRSVSLVGARLILVGERSTLIQDASKRLPGLSGHDEMTLDVDLQDADLASILPRISSLLFFPDPETAINALPARVRDFLPYDVSHTRHAGVTWINDGGQWHSVPIKDPMFVRPVPIVMPDPKFTDQARQEKTNGLVAVVFEITDSGQVKDFWLGNSLKNGLTDQALVVARGYRFKPGRYGGKNAGTELLAEISFHIE